MGDEYFHPSQDSHLYKDDQFLVDGKNHSTGRNAVTPDSLFVFIVCYLF